MIFYFSLKQGTSDKYLGKECSSFTKKQLCPQPVTTECLYFRSHVDPIINRDRKQKKGILEKGQQGFLLTPESPVKGRCKQRKGACQLVSN